MASLLKSQVVVETAILTGARTVLFYFCRTYLLRSLYQDLRHLQALPSTSSLDIPLEPSAPLSPHLTSPPPSPNPLLRANLTFRDASLHDSSDNLTLPTPSTAQKRTKSSLLSWLPLRRSAPKTLPSTYGEGSFQSMLSRTAFAICFSESCILFLLVMCQALSLLSPSTRTFNWNVSLTILVTLILLIIPLLQCIFITYRPLHGSQHSSQLGPTSRRITRRVILTLIPYLAYIFAVFRIPVPESLALASLTIRSLSRLAVVGVLILGLISGFGAISTAWMFFQDTLFFRTSDSSIRLEFQSPASTLEPTSSEISAAEHSLARIRADLLERRQDVDRRALGGDQSGSSSGWMTKIFGKGDPELSGIQREVVGLEALEVEMLKDLQELKFRKARIQYSKTFKGRVWRWIGWIFGLYCAFRVLSSIVNLAFPGRTRSSPTQSAVPDLATGLFVYLLSLLPFESFHLSHQQISALSRQVSLVMVGAIVLVSVRGILRGIGRVLRFTSGIGSNKSNNINLTPSNATGPATRPSSARSLVANFMLLVLAQVMGVYLLSTLIQLRLSFPPTTQPTEGPVSSEPSLFSTLPSYEVFNSLFDWTFLASAGLTAMGRWIGGKIGL